MRHVWQCPLAAKHPLAIQFQVLQFRTLNEFVECCFKCIFKPSCLLLAARITLTLLASLPRITYMQLYLFVQLSLRYTADSKLAYSETYSCCHQSVFQPVFALTYSESITCVVFVVCFSMHYVLSNPCRLFFYRTSCTKNTLHAHHQSTGSLQNWWLWP